jgi:hypothetical protein
MSGERTSLWLQQTEHTGSHLLLMLLPTIDIPMDTYCAPLLNDLFYTLMRQIPFKAFSRMNIEN